MTDLQAANKALTLIGVEPVGSLADNSKAARTVNSLIPGVKDIVLGEFPWSFAARMEPLVSAPATPPSGYLYVFAYPAAAVGVFRVFMSGYRIDSIPFTVAEIGGANYIATNFEACDVEYTVRIDGLHVWRSDVAECFVTRLAHDAAYTLTSDQNITMALFEKYAMQVQAAKANSVVEEKRPQAEALDYVLVRR